MVSHLCWAGRVWWQFGDGVAPNGQGEDREWQKLRNVPGRRMEPAREKETAQGPGKPGEEKIYQREFSVWCPDLRWDREEKGQEH